MYIITKKKNNKVSVINKQTSKSKNVMTLVRNLVLCLLQNNTTFRSEHVPGSSNKIILGKVTKPLSLEQLF